MPVGWKVELGKVVEELDAQPAKEVMSADLAFRPLLHCQVAEMPLVDFPMFGNQGTIAGRTKAAARGSPCNLADEPRFAFGRDACKKLSHCLNFPKHLSIAIGGEGEGFLRSTGLFNRST